MPQSSASAATEQTRPQADPLPAKVGELDYVPPTTPVPISNNVSDEPVLPARHPADRDHNDAIAGERARTEVPPNSAAAAASSTRPSSTTAIPNPNGKGWILRYSWKGISPITLLRITLLFLFMIITGVAWALTVMRIAADGAASESEFGGDGSDQPDDGRIRLPPAFSSLVFVHVSFTVVTLFELLFLERAIFHARAERFLFNHGVPRGEGGRSVASMGLAPWSRPPLPTYAAALAESGVGTGDVEDNLIAIPPPPAYGNTRGSTLLLAGLLPSNLVRTFSRATSNTHRTSAQSGRSRRGGTESRMEEGGNRPISYDESEEVTNAKRARDLELALAKLEADREKP